MSFALIGLKTLSISWTKKAFEDFISTLWNIWNNRNNVIFRGNDEDAGLIWDRACKLNDDFRSHNFSFQPILPQVPRSCKWEKPSEGVTKVNVDASADALGIIARDSDGFVLRSKAVFINRVVNSEWAESNALIEGFWLAHSLNSDKVIFETDYASIVNRFRKHKEDIMILGHRIKEACKMLDSFSKADVNLVDRG
ncbi:hypothetical protein Godav_004543 [Gossypium davidsonii]|uniref:RNase H type-1 domain-containing protein n=1 Tax=Gossypium davidsonii TaxID=34287 RepID=A0A7J8SMD9_GOSDV|nr:hypothetical protein [Gossypium davidsonii]